MKAVELFAQPDIGQQLQQQSKKFAQLVQERKISACPAMRLLGCLCWTDLQLLCAVEPTGTQRPFLGDLLRDVLDSKDHSAEGESPQAELSATRAPLKAR